MHQLERYSAEVASQRLDLHPPYLLLRVLERFGWEIEPKHICQTGQVEQLCDKYPDLWGDRTAIGPSDDAKCQSWRDNPGWWREIVAKERHNS